jgi:hypothetical protein
MDGAGLESSDSFTRVDSIQRRISGGQARSAA